MNIETLKKYNALHAAAQPVTLKNNNQTIEGPVPDSLWPCISDLEKSATDEATRIEIMEAAKEGRPASALYCEWGNPYYAGNPDRKGIPWPDSARRWALIVPQLIAMIDAHNKSTREAFWIYRQACAQGVAVPPL